VNWRCRLGWHDWRRDAGTKTEDIDRPDGSYEFRWVVRCQRCHTPRHVRLFPTKEHYIPPKGREMRYPSANGTGYDEPYEETPEMMKACVRPGTRDYGTLRDGTTPTPGMCDHFYKDHGGLRYYGEGRVRFKAGECKDCSCEGFIG